MKTVIRGALCLVALVLLQGSQSAVWAAEPALADYTAYPVFQVNAVPPNIMVIMDNSGSMNSAAYGTAYDHANKYYGYFEPYKKYSYSSNVFKRDPAGSWDGNFLNWVTMRRVDVARKVMVGGLSTPRPQGVNPPPGPGKVNLIGENTSTGYYQYYTEGEDVTPYGTQVQRYYVYKGTFRVQRQKWGSWSYTPDAIATFNINVEKDENNFPDEAVNFKDGYCVGILQRVSDKARWGVEFFDTTGKEGGSIGARVIGTSMITLNQDLQDKACGTWTPLAESYFVAMKYYMQKKITEISGYSTNEPPCANAGDDPYLLDGKEIYCAKSFVLLITDGASTQDQAIPSAYKDYDGEKNAKLKFFHDDSIVPTFGSSGSSYLADLALYAKVTDLRSSTIGKNNLEGNQNIILYPVYAFGDNSYDSKAARALLKTTAMNGGFEDRNGNNKPDFDLPEEWDRDGDGIPDNYYEATDGYALEAQLARAINDILKRSASGTAVASTVTSEEGEGTALQAYFKPTLTNDDMTEEISWVGYVQSLWLDYYGNLREDTDQDLALDIGMDKIVKTYLEPGTGEVRARLYDVSADAPYPDTSDGSNSTFYTVPLEELRALWKGDERLRD